MENKFNYFIVFCILLLLILFLFLNKSLITFKAISEINEAATGEFNLGSIVNDLNYEPNTEKEIKFIVFNSENKNMQVLLSVNGELNNSITLFDKVVEFSPSDLSKTFNSIIKMEESLEPGLHKAEITALEIPIASNNEYIGSKSKIVSIINVHVPYPGKYVEADLSVTNAVSNETANFVITAVNRGKERIDEAKAIIEIYTLLGERITNIETNSVSIDSGMKSELVSELKIEISSGDYIAKYNINYDGETKNFEKQFAVGAKNLSIEGILVNNFQLGEIAKLQILVENKWNQQLEDVYANLIVYNKNNQIITDVKSSNENIPALSKKELIAYWDTIGIEKGSYNGRLMVKYGKRSSDKNLILEVNDDSLDIFGVGYTIRPSSNRKDLVNILMVMIIILLIANLAWFVFFKRTIFKKKNKIKRSKKK